VKDYLQDSWLPIPPAPEARARGLSLDDVGPYALLSYGRASPFANWLIPRRRRFEDGHAAGALERATVFFADLGMPWSVLVFDEQQSWFAPRLSAEGMIVTEVVECSVGATASASPPDEDVRLVDDEDDLERALRLDDGYEDHTPEQFARALAAGVERMRAGDEFWFLSFDGGEPVATASMRFVAEPRLGYLSGATTTPSHRRQGHYGALLAARLVHAAGLGYEYGATHAVSTTSAPILRAHGFSCLATLTVMARRVQ